MDIFKKVLGNINDNLSDIDKHHVEKVIIENDDLLKKMIVAHSDHHREVTIAIDDNSKLKDGDILFNDGHNLIYLIINHDKLIEIIPDNFNEMGYVAHNLGNRHIPCQFIDNKIYLVFDPLIESWLKANGYHFEIVNKKLEKPFRHANLS